MKKILALVMTLCLLCGAAALAESSITPDSQTATASVTYVIEAKDEYTVVIPSAITIDSETATGSFTVKVLTGANLVSGNELFVKLMSTTNDFKLMDEDGNSVAYTVKRGTLTPWKSNSELGDTGKVLFSQRNGFPLQEDKVSDTILITVTGKGVVGTYSDQLNFSVSIGQ